MHQKQFSSLDVQNKNTGIFIQTDLYFSLLLSTKKSIPHLKANVKNTCLKWFDLRLQDFLVSILVGYLCQQVMLEHPHKNQNPDNIAEQVYTPFSSNFPGLIRRPIGPFAM